MMRPWDRLDTALPIRNALAEIVPILTTERLVLRGPVADDWPLLSPIWRTDRGQFIGGPFNEEDAWLDFCQSAAGWLLRGFGYWVITAKGNDRALGIIGVGQETADPEIEFGWLLLKEAEGKGYAYEAAKAVRAYAFETLGLSSLVSFIDLKNHRSIALARRLGAVEDPQAVPHEYVGVDMAYRQYAPNFARPETDTLQTGGTSHE